MASTQDADAKPSNLIAQKVQAREEREDSVLREEPAFDSQTTEGRSPSEEAVKTSAAANTSGVSKKLTNTKKRGRKASSLVKKVVKEKSRNLVRWDKAVVLKLMVLNAEKALWDTVKDKAQVYNLLCRNIYGTLNGGPTPEAAEQKFSKWRNQLKEDGEIVPDLIDKRANTCAYAREKRLQGKTGGIRKKDGGQTQQRSTNEAPSGGRRSRGGRPRANALQGFTRPLLAAGSGAHAGDGDGSDSDDDGSRPPSNTPESGTPTSRYKRRNIMRRVMRDHDSSDEDEDAAEPLTNLPATDTSDGEFGVTMPAKRKGKTKRGRHAAHFVPKNGSPEMDAFKSDLNRAIPNNNWNIASDGEDPFVNQQDSNQAALYTAANRSTNSLQVSRATSESSLSTSYDGPAPENIHRGLMLKFKVKDWSFLKRKREASPEETSKKQIIVQLVEPATEAGVENKAAAVKAVALTPQPVAVTGETSSPQASTLSIIQADPSHPTKKTRKPYGSRKVKVKTEPPAIGPIQQGFIDELARTPVIPQDPINTEQSQSPSFATTTPWRQPLGVRSESEMDILRRHSSSQSASRSPSVSMDIDFRMPGLPASMTSREAHARAVDGENQNAMMQNSSLEFDSTPAMAPTEQSGGFHAENNYSQFHGQLLNAAMAQEYVFPEQLPTTPVVDYGHQPTTTNNFYNEPNQDYGLEQTGYGNTLDQNTGFEENGSTLGTPWDGNLWGQEMNQGAQGAAEAEAEELMDLFINEAYFEGL